MEYYHSKLSKLFNLIIFFIIFYLVYYLFQNNLSLFGVTLDLDIIYQGNLKNYKNLYLIYYPLLSLSLSFYLSYRIIISFILAPLSLSIFSREYFKYIFVKWKIYTFALAFIFLFFIIITRTCRLWLFNYKQIWNYIFIYTMYSNIFYSSLDSWKYNKIFF